MTPLERLRLEKAAADCGFEMTPLVHPDGLEMRSAVFPESVLVHIEAGAGFSVTSKDPYVLDVSGGADAVKVESLTDLYAFLRAVAGRARTRPDRVADVYKSKIAGMPRSTEAERLVIQRVGQDLFRNALLDYWQGRCCVTQLDAPVLLRASHIRPWADCETDEERLDVFNGLLLAPHLDAMFDTGFMTIGESGEVLLSKSLTAGQRRSLGVTSGLHLENLRPRHQEYLAFHRRMVWRG